MITTRAIPSMIFAVLVLTAGRFASADQSTVQSAPQSASQTPPPVYKQAASLPCPPEHTQVITDKNDLISLFCVFTKNKDMKDGPYEIRSVKPAQVQERGVYKMGTAFPSFKAPVMSADEKEARQLLMSLRNDVATYKAENGFYTTDLVENAFLPIGDTAYACGFKTPSGPPGKGAHNTAPVNPKISTSDNSKYLSGVQKKWNYKFKYTGKAKLSDFPESGFKGDNYTAACVLRMPKGLDIWTINEKGEIKHLPKKS
jgi:hypothetical protein